MSKGLKSTNKAPYRRRTPEQIAAAEAAAQTMVEVYRKVNRKMVPKTLDLLLGAFDGDVDAMLKAVETYCAAEKQRLVAAQKLIDQFEEEEVRDE